MNSTGVIAKTENLAFNPLNKTRMSAYCENFTLKTTEMVFALVLGSSICVGGSFGNIIVVVVIRRTPNLRTICGVLICNLALADLLVSSVVVPMVIFCLIRGVVPQCSSTTPGSVLLAIGRYSTTVSLLILALLSMDRCWAIASPLGHKLRMTSSMLRNVLASVWSVSPIIPVLEGFDFAQNEILIRLNTAGIVVCLFAIVMSGVVTVAIVRHRSSKIRNVRGSHRQGEIQVSACLRKRDQQVAKTIALVVALFSLCWVPILTVTVILPDHYTNLHFWAGFWGLANSALNPSLYFYRQENYRQAFRDIIYPQMLSSVVTQINIPRKEL
ncbi:Beta-1 adrenergic receptor [Acropora cervicornis]|uniref:Beta-1 adrenergic receptor n=1 Tax=Acropora cervicornis TaxID=6130 RepID=A0AAD9Q9N2_ACRCE|nr:Beta-1 adrenergic receptor [Acropora cervicornis]